MAENVIVMQDEDEDIIVASKSVSESTLVTDEKVDSEIIAETVTPVETEIVDPTSVANEAADLVFHLQVALAHKNVSWTKVLKVLAKRRGGPRRKQ